MIRTSLMNGVINLDSDFSKYIESISEPGVIKGFEIQNSAIQPGQARVKCERTNGETIYCYVESTEEVALSGNDAKIYIVVDQEDIDSGLVSEDGLNIARIEEGANRPEKNFLKLGSKNGGLIIDEREVVKKIDEVNEEIGEEIDGLDERLTEAEHDIQQIISQSGSALSYLDTTCYAGEKIHENDLIATNGNSFNPDRTDEELLVGGTTVNKYAIGFTANGESAEKVYVKGCLMEGFEPNSITVNVESDDNGKPSGTVIDTVEARDYFKRHGDESSFVNYDGDDFSDGVYPECGSGGIAKILSCFGIGNGQIKDVSDSTNRILQIKTDKGYIEMNFGSKTDCGELLDCTEDGLTFVMKKANKTIRIYRLLTPFNITGAVSNDYSFTELPNVNIAYGHIFDGGTKLLLSTLEFASSANTKLYYFKTETSFDFSTYTAQDLLGGMYTSVVDFLNTFFEWGGKWYLYVYWSYNSGNRRLVTIDENGDAVVSTGDYNAVYGYHVYYGEELLFISKSNGTIKEFGYTDLYFPKKIKIPLTNTITTTKGNKYWITIYPTITGSVVDSIKISDKEGEYYSECAVRDLNAWSNVSNKTPYIDATCIKARYARKVNENNILYREPCGFANGDFTELESVSYCFKGIKSGFHDLDPNTSYFSDSEGGITTKPNLGSYVGCSVGEDKLLVDFKKLGKVPFNTDFSLVNRINTDETRTITIIEDGRAIIKYQGIGSITINGETFQTFNSNSFTEKKVYLYLGDVITVTVRNYSTSVAGEVDILF